VNLDALRELLPLYALDALSPAEREQVEAGLNQHPELQAELTGLRAASAELMLALPPEPLPAGLEEKVVRRVVSPRLEPVKALEIKPLSLPWTRLIAPLAAAAALVVAVWAGTWGWGWFQALGDPRSQVINLVDSGGNTVGRALIRSDRKTFLVLSDAPLPSGKVYQAWGIGQGQPIPLNTFRRKVVVIALPPGANALAVSAEPPGGSAQPTQVLGLPKL
jgi:hypothetical protein